MRYSGTLKRAGIGILTGSVVVAAFATIAPSPEAGLPPASQIFTEALPLQTTRATLPAPESYLREERFQRGDTVSALLSRLGISDSHIARLARMRALHALRPGFFVTAEVSSEGELRSLSYLTGRDTLVQVIAEGEELRASEERAPLEIRTAMKSAVVRSSLFAAADAADIPDSVAMQLADVFGGDVDFHRDLRKGDRFTVVYEMHYLRGRPVRAGRMQAAEFVNQGKTYRAVHFGSGYYAPDGKAMRKAFLRSPLEFSRVTSGFGMRQHPIMQVWRAHKGIDYAAPTGTRVRAVGDGIVEFAGPKGGYGNMVVLRHHGQYATVYAHLSRIAVKRGARVTQNDTIGSVGQTGWATGPHLHYEFRIAGEARNPLAIAMPAALPVAASELPAFQTHAASLVARLDLLANSNLALLE
jgi:murein DD-endopeptidase MepM/ murein hydrolase activator NlpD